MLQEYLISGAMVDGDSAQVFDGRDVFGNDVLSLVKRATERMMRIVAYIMTHIERVTLGSSALSQTQ